MSNHSRKVILQTRERCRRERLVHARRFRELAYRQTSPLLASIVTAIAEDFDQKAEEQNDAD